ncbi:hypothetical protein CEXT_266171 [Caerostris extrusa]|uniref:Uncharacterized protein n=1 Tax=Caerostris extrusa TaxID=172846 RepID=A0AAV4VA39_CAEEX|nr:hypothetical protein CEXT_266171 [Caerostris extrusa]
MTDLLLMDNDDRSLLMEKGEIIAFNDGKGEKNRFIDVETNVGRFLFVVLKKRTALLMEKEATLWLGWTFCSDNASKGTCETSFSSHINSKIKRKLNMQFETSRVIIPRN